MQRRRSCAHVNRGVFALRFEGRVPTASVRAARRSIQAIVDALGAEGKDWGAKLLKRGPCQLSSWIRCQGVGFHTSPGMRRSMTPLVNYCTSIYIGACPSLQSNTNCPTMHQMICWRWCPLPIRRPHARQVTLQRSATSRKLQPVPQAAKTLAETRVLPQATSAWQSCTQHCCCWTQGKCKTSWLVLVCL